MMSSQNTTPAMNDIKFAVRLLLVAVAALLTTACSTHKVPYQPTNSIEKAILERSHYEFSPHEIRKSSDEHIHTLVSWVGAIEDMQFTLSGGPAAARILLRHQSVDFNTYSPESDTLEIRSEAPSGYFQIAWPIAGYQEYEKLRSLAPGSYLIAYGYPTEIVNGVVGLNPLVYVRPMGDTQSALQR